jgi:hypothetical protein
MIITQDHPTVKYQVERDGDADCSMKPTMGILLFPFKFHFAAETSREMY